MVTLRVILVVGLLVGGFLSHELPKWCESLSVALAAEFAQR